MLKPDSLGQSLAWSAKRQALVRAVCLRPGLVLSQNGDSSVHTTGLIGELAETKQGNPVIFVTRFQLT